MKRSILVVIVMLMIAPIAKAEGNSTIINPIKGIQSFVHKTNDDPKDVEEAVIEAKEIISGIVSWYADKFHGKKTSSGEAYNKNDYTAAHKTLPFGTKVKVTNQDNGKSVIVKINDRGPHTKNRLMDLSRAAFSEIGSINSGILKVEMEVVE